MTGKAKGKPSLSTPRQVKNFIFVHPHLHIGGAETQSVMLANELVSRGHCVRFIFHKRTGKLLSRLDPKIQTYTLGTDSHAALPILVLRMQRILERLEPSLVIVKLWSAMFTTYLATRNGTKHKVVMCEDLDPAEHWKKMKFGRLKLGLVGHIYRNSRNVTANTETVATRMEEVYKLTSRPRVYYGAVDPSEIQRRAKEVLELPGFDLVDRNTIQVTTIASLHKRKGHLDCLKALTQTDLNWTWHVIGEGPELTAIEQRIPQEFKDHVTLHGALENPMPVLSKSDLLLHLSHSEAFGLVLLEAIALGVPVITSKTIGACEIKRILQVPDHRMTLVERNDVEEIARTMQTLAFRKRSEGEIKSDLLGAFGLKATADRWVRSFDDFL